MNEDKNDNIDEQSTKEDNDMNATIERPCSITESIIESCKQVKLMQEGKLPKKTWKELRVELQKIKEEDND